MLPAYMQQKLQDLEPQLLQMRQQWQQTRKQQELLQAQVQQQQQSTGVCTTVCSYCGLEQGHTFGCSKG